MQTRYHQDVERTADLPDLAPYSDSPRYNMHAVEKATGVSPRTLRSWERRYGIPTPRRDTGGRRLYSERDIALIRWLMGQIERGMSIGRAVAMVSEEGDGVGNRRSGPDLKRFQLRLLQAIDWMDEEEVTSIVSAAIEAAPVETVVVELIQPALYRVGELWAAGRMSVTSEHFGTHLLRSILADLLRRSPQPWRPYHILVGCAPGEMHDVGALVLALFLRRAGFRVTYLGANLEGHSLQADLQRIRPDAVCLSATTDSGAGALSALYGTIDKTFAGILAYGGGAFGDDPKARYAIPGMYLDADAQKAVERLAAVLAQKESLG